MKFTFAFNHTIARLLIVIYLALPAVNLDHGAFLDKVMPGAQTLTGMPSPAVPCDDQPCDGGHDSGCCDMTCCSCECHAPLGRNPLLKYAPVIASQNFPEPYWSLPQVCLPIFVPPQSLS